VAIRTYRDYLVRIAPRVLRSLPGQKLVGLTGLLCDYIAEGARQAVRAMWIGDRTGNGPAYDALEPGGRELSLPRYPGETWASYHARLQRAWTDWPVAGHETSIEAQLAAAGFPGAVIFYVTDWPGFLTSWSQFVVFYPAGMHPVTGPGPAYGSFNWGDGTTFGPTGITAEQLGAMRAIIRKFKPGHWVCRAIVFELSGWTFGTGHTYGEPGLVYGGETIYVGV